MTVVFLTVSCRTRIDLVLDDPVFFENMVDAVLQGSQFKIIPDDYPDIRNLLGNTQPKYRMAGVILAGQADTGKLYPDIVEAALDENLEVSATSKKLIGHQLDVYYQYIIALLDDPDPLRRSGGLLLLSEFGEEDILPILIQYFNDADEEVRNQASLAVREVGERNNPFLQEAMESSNPLTASIAWRTLGRYNNPDDIPVFIKTFSSDNSDIRREVQVATFRQGEAALPFLHKAAGDSLESRRVRLAALDVIQGMRSTNSLEQLFSLLDDEDPRFQQKAETVLGTYGTEAVPALSQLYRQSSETTRLYAVRLLGKIGSLSALPLLVKAQSDGSLTVRLGAMDALRRFGNEAWPAMHENLSDNAVILLREGADPWLVTLENGEPNLEVLFILITISAVAELEDYLVRAGITKLKAETIMSLAEAWRLAEKFAVLDKRITEGYNSPYLRLWKQRELNLLSSRAMLEDSFDELHAYFDVGDPAKRDTSNKKRKESRRLETLAREQKMTMDSMPEDEQKVAEIAMLKRYRAMREILVRTWVYTLPSLRPLARKIYHSRSVDPESLVNQRTFIE